ncbi:MAG: FG-GAP repeat protein [Ignavibacteria bacterium]|nr:MAG: FG-GAP repeat protein [Ignavibacteria bacterium]KAF0160980.1 MAG: FG-GAP repeat protein [Ignavibacteria bacterium]
MRSFKISVIKLLSVMTVMLMLGTSIAFAQVSVTFPTVSGAVGSSTTVPIIVGDPGTNVFSYQFTLSYDKNIIDVTGIETADTKSASGQISSNPDLANGKLNVAWANNSALTGSGTLLKIKITFKAAGMTDLDPMATFLFNSGVPAANVTKGKATAASIQVFVDNVSTTGLATEILIPVKTTALAATDNVYSFDLTGAFDATRLELTGYSLTGTLGDGGQAAINYNNTTGTYSFAWANGTKISGVGTLFNLKAKAKAKAASTVSIVTFKYNAGAPAVVTSNGTITVANQKPVFAAASQTLTGAENSALALTVVATDGDNDVLTYTATGLPLGATLSTAGAFAWTPSFIQAGTYAVVITASDGAETATMTLNITITDVNRTPTITLTPAGPYTVAEGTPLTIKAVGADVDTDNTITLSATGLPSGASFAAATGDFAWTPNFAQAGSYSVVFTVRDNKTASASITAAITVTNVNGAPRFDVAGARQMPDTTVKAGLNFVFTFRAIDPQGDVVSYYLNQPAPSNAIIVPSTGVFGWRPANTQAGKHYIVVSASDGILTTNSRIATVTVQPDLSADESGIPTAFELFQNYPNPFNPTTNIKYALPKESRVRIAVFNILGQEVATLVNSVMQAGYHSVDFKANNIPSGMYIYKIETESFSQVKKMLLMK